MLSKLVARVTPHSFQFHIKIMVTGEIILVQYIISMTSFGAELLQLKYMHMDKGEKSLTMEENLNLSTVILTEGKRMGGICLFSSE